MRDTMPWILIGIMPVYVGLVAEFARALDARRRVGGPRHMRPWGVYYVVTIIVTAILVFDAITHVDPLNVLMRGASILGGIVMAHFFRTWRDEDDDGDGLASRVKRSVKSLVRARRLTPAPVAR